MLEFLYTYGLFLAKAITIVAAILIVISAIAAIASKGKKREKLTLKKLNEKYQEMKETLNREILSKKAFKQLAKEEKKQAKQKKQASKAADGQNKRVFVLNFKGDIRATAVDALREAITAILSVATTEDEVVVNVESGGGTIHGYGLAASQLRRIRDRKIPLTATIDKVAASGGYLMACVADRILAAPFAIVGSIGVLAQLPNFNRLLKKHDIEFEQITGGEYKRTLSLFGENTSKGRKKFQETIDDAHELFKQFVITNRPTLDIQKVATGEYWHGTQAVDLGLVDELQTSDDYLMAASNSAEIFEIHYTIPKKKLNKLASAVKAELENFTIPSSTIL
ncbi:MAG: protease SohB [Gammaproteobacteria bacterium]|nr:protease SohB [Gammaproteobacteria bacterium]